MTEKKDLSWEILKILKAKKGECVSGEKIAEKIGISRQALWKHIAKLSDLGYEIEATPHVGYKLKSIPDKLYPWEIQGNLNTKFIGKKIHYHKSLDSTQNIGWNLGLTGAEEGEVIVTETQEKGRGRMQRDWVSPLGGIYLSLLLRPQFLLIQDVPQITLLIGLGCIYGIKKATGIECQVKWPNDIYLKGKKVGGILCEIQAEADQVHFVVCGIGINVNTKDLPQEATSLFLNTKSKLSRIDVTKRILEEIENCYLRAQREGFYNILKEWGNYCILWGRRIRVNISNNEVEGEAQGIDEKGYLLIRKDSGFIEKISAADTVKVIVN
jgi:BirA family biotin operon repressor/biotin-[acetyl-CoA-carboxylase] ligase